MALVIETKRYIIDFEKILGCKNWYTDDELIYVTDSEDSADEDSEDSPRNILIYYKLSIHLWVRPCLSFIVKAKIIGNIKIIYIC